MRTKSLSALFFGIFFIGNLSVLAAEKLYVPSRPQSPAPLFVAIHGCLSSAEESEQTTRMSEFAEKHGFYVFYPEPALGDAAQGCMDFYSKDSQRPGGGDAFLVIKKIEQIRKIRNIDEKRIYVLGMSAGASLVSVLTSCYPEVFAGAAIHSGMGYGLASTWQESLLIAHVGPLPNLERNTACSPSNYKGKLFLVHGSRDQIMHERHYSALKKDYLPNLVAQISLVAPELYRYPYLHERFFDGHQLRAQGVYVLGMNHEWSGAKPMNPLGPRGPDVSSMMVEYFLDHQ